jgi:hypothetical protein
MEWVLGNHWLRAVIIDCNRKEVPIPHHQIQNPLLTQLQTYDNTKATKNLSQVHWKSHPLIGAHLPNMYTLWRLTIAKNCNFFNLFRYRQRWRCARWKHTRTAYTPLASRIHSYMVTVIFRNKYRTYACIGRTFLPQIQGEEWGVAYIRNNFTLHFKKKL